MSEVVELVDQIFVSGNLKGYIRRDNLYITYAMAGIVGKQCAIHGRRENPVTTAKVK